MSHCKLLLLLVYVSFLFTFVDPGRKRKLPPDKCPDPKRRITSWFPPRNNVCLPNEAPEPANAENISPNNDVMNDENPAEAQAPEVSNAQDERHAVEEDDNIINMQNLIEQAEIESQARRDEQIGESILQDLMAKQMGENAAVATELTEHDIASPTEEVKNNDDEIDSDAYSKRDKKKLEKYVIRFPFVEYDFSNKKWRCDICDSVAETLTWFNIPEKLNGLLENLRSHTGEKQNKAGTRGRNHNNALLKKQQEDQLERDRVTIERYEAQQQLINQMTNAAVLRRTQDMKDAKILLDIAIFVAAENLAIRKFVPLKQLIANLLIKTRRDPSLTWPLLLAKFNKLSKLVQQVQNEELKKAMKTSLADLKKAVYNSFPTGIPARVTNGEETNKILVVVADQLFNNILERIRKSPTFSILIDESTDRSKVEQMTVTVIFVENGEKVSKYLGLVPLKNLNAETIFKYLINFLTDICKLDLSRWVGLGTDGASVMTGQHSGVAKRVFDMMQEKFKLHFIALHCVAHITALSGKAGAASSVTSQALDVLIQQIASDFSRSTIQNENLKDIIKMFNSEVQKNKVLRIVPFHRIRWLSRINSLKRITKLLKFLLIHYENRASSDNCPRYGHLTNYSLLRFMFFMVDALEPLRIITEAAQSTTITIVWLKNIVANQIQKLENLQLRFGENEGSFLDKIVKTDELSNIRWTRSHGPHVPQVYTLYGHKISFSEFMKTNVERARIAFLQSVVEDLRARFSGLNEKLVPLEMFYDLMNVSQQIMETNSKNLSKLYNIDALELESQILSLQSLMIAKNLKFTSFKKFAKHVLTFTSPSEFKHVHFFLSLVLVLPFSTADCERAFSAMNNIKSASRNRLKDILRALMMIYAATSEEKYALDRDEMATTIAVKVWDSKRSRAGWATARYLESII